ncbi:MAG: hypothetical protein DRI61_03440 [Chloroflexi bacterium]|nr:MAG: hypothetical protein DRI61_03440 [Chloroflexota bacterium]
MAEQQVDNNVLPSYDVKVTDDGSGLVQHMIVDEAVQPELPAGLVDSTNSTATPLTSGSTFTGTAIDITDYGIIFINTYSDQASATDGLVIEQSSDGTNWDHDDVYTVPAGGAKNYSINPYAQYMRVKYTNGGVNQTAFRLQTLLKANSKPSSHRIQDSIVDEDDAELVKSVLSAKANGGGFVNITATESNNLRVTEAESGLAIAKGEVTGHSFVHKFGAAPDFDVADGFVTVWDGAEDDEDYEAMQYTYSATADIDYIVAEAAGDTQDVEIQGLDANYDLVVQTKTLAGNTPVELDTYLTRVFRMKNVNSTDFTGHVFVYVSGGTVTAGVPQVGADVRAVVHDENNQTEMAVYTIPNGKTGYMRSWYASTAGAKRDSSHTIKILARPFGQVFQLKHKANIDVNGTSYIHHEYIEPEVFAAKTDIEIQMDTDTNIAGVAAGFDIILVDD